MLSPGLHRRRCFLAMVAAGMFVLLLSPTISDSQPPSRQEMLRRAERRRILEQIREEQEEEERLQGEQRKESEETEDARPKRPVPPPDEAYAGFKLSSSAAQIRMVNSKRIRFNCEIKGVGPSGVEAVEAWGTRDAQKWTKYNQFDNPKPPFIVEVAGEGRYGFTLIPRSGVGLARSAPTSGESPQVWLEVDLTPPQVKLGTVRVGEGPNLGMVTIEYTARDKHFGPNPIALAYARTPEGPWVNVAEKLENTGYYTWKMPPNMPYRFVLKVEASDLAGNVGSAVSATPVIVDLARPESVILGIDIAK